MQYKLKYSIEILNSEGDHVYGFGYNTEDNNSVLSKEEILYELTTAAFRAASEPERTINPNINK